MRKTWGFLVALAVFTAGAPLYADSPKISCPQSNPDNCYCVNELGSAGADKIQIDPSDSICLIGKLESTERLVDFTVSSNFTTPNQTTEGQFFDLIKFTADDLSADGSFKISQLPIGEEGHYTFRVTARSTPQGGTSSVYHDVAGVVRIDRPGKPGFAPVSVKVIEGTPKDISKNLTDVSGNGTLFKGGEDAVNASKVEFCVQPVTQNETIQTPAVVTAQTTVTDTTLSQLNPRVVSLKKVEAAENPQPASDSFCPKGYLVSDVLVAHGLNHIDVQLKTDGGIQAFAIEIFVDQQGPVFSVSYVDPNGNEKKEETPIILAPLNKPLTVKVVVNSRPVGKNSLSQLSVVNGLSATINGKGIAVVKKEGEGYQFEIDPKQVRYPVNFLRVQGTDTLGNPTESTFSFAYGDVRHPYDAAGNLKVSKGIVPSALGGFLPEEYVTGQLKEDILHILNTREFKLHGLPKLFEIKKPSQAESDACGEGSRIFFTDGQMTKLDVPKESDKEAMKEIDDMSFEIPSFYLLNENTLWIQLLLKNFKRKAEIFTVEFDQDIMDEIEAYEEANPDATDEDWAKENPDNNPDKLPGKIIPDRLLGLKVLPVKFGVKELALNLKVHLDHDEKGNLTVEIEPVPERDLVEAIGIDNHLVNFRCDQEKSEIRDIDGSHPFIETEGCNAIKNLNEMVNDQGVNETSDNQNIDHQFMTILGTMVSCNIPHQVVDQFAKYDTDLADPKEVIQTKLELFDRRLFLDFFAPLGKSDARINTWGISFAGGGLLLPAGMEDADGPEGTYHAKGYMEKLPKELRTDPSFGPLFDPEARNYDAIQEAQDMASSLNLAIREDIVNSIVFGSSQLLHDVEEEILKEGNGKNLPMDLDQKILLEKMGLGINELGKVDKETFGEKSCINKEGSSLLTNNNLFDNWKCFPQPMLLDVAFASLIQDDLVISQLDLDGNGAVGGGEDNVPMMFRTRVNSYFPLAVKLVKGASVNGPKAEKPSQFPLTLELDLGSSLMDLYEEVPDNRKDILKPGNLTIKDWCDEDRVNSVGKNIFMNPTKCQSTGGKKKGPLPIATFRSNGKITLELWFTVEDGVLTVEGGLVSKIKSIGDDGTPEVELDADKTFLDFNVVENNTLTPDNKMVDMMKEMMSVILGQFTFGTNNDIRVRIPLSVPLGAAFCKAHPDLNEVCDCVANPDGNGCGLVKSVSDFWKDLDVEKYDLGGGELEELLLTTTHPSLGAPRYLGIGIDAVLDYLTPGMGQKTGALTEEPAYKYKNANDYGKFDKKFKEEDFEKDKPWWSFW